MGIGSITSNQVENTGKVTKNENGNQKNIEQGKSSIDPIKENPSSQNIDKQQLTQTQASAGVTLQHTKSDECVHPHLGEEFTEPINKIFNQEKINGDKDESVIKNKLLEKGIIDKDGVINWGKLGLGPIETKKNHIKGHVWIDDNGKFQVKVNGYAGESLKKAFGKLKDEVGGIADNQNLKNPITLDPAVLGKPSDEDMEILKRGGQIQYRSLGEENPPKTLKLVLDPGKADGQDDGLTVSVLVSDNKGNIFPSSSVLPKKIPLSAVFEGNVWNERKTDHAILADWRTNRYFERSAIQKKYERYIPFTSLLDKKQSDNTDDVGRTQAQNTLWNAVNEYLKLAVAEDMAMTSWDSSGKNENAEGVKNQNIDTNENANSIPPSTQGIHEVIQKDATAPKDYQNINPQNGILEETAKSSESQEMAGPQQAKNRYRAIAKSAKKNNKYIDLRDAAKELADSIKKLADIAEDPVMQNVKEGRILKTGNPVQEIREWEEVKSSNDDNTVKNGRESVRTEVHRPIKGAKENNRKKLLEAAKAFSETIKDIANSISLQGKDLNQEAIDNIIKAGKVLESLLENEDKKKLEDALKEIQNNSDGNMDDKLSQLLKVVSEIIQNVGSSRFGPILQNAMQGLKEQGMNVETGNFKLK